MTVTTLSYYRFGPLTARLWAFTQMGLARRALSRAEGVRFWKLFGTGTGQGFTPLPNTGLWAVLSTWDDLSTARAAQESTSVFKRFRESLTTFKRTNNGATASRLHRDHPRSFSRF